jgi:2-C-methyl-D-erythritol 4-phosphate cytidylyltransferase
LQKETDLKKANVTAILLAAGVSNRMNSDVTKQLISIDGVSIVRRAALAFDASCTITNIIIVARESEISDIKEQTRDIPKVTAVIPGGECRAMSAKIGFLAVRDSSEFVAVHDAARCLVTPEMIDSVVSVALTVGAASAAMPVTDTVKRVDGNLNIVGTVKRDELYFTTTPQVFSSELYSRALDNYTGDLSLVTDDNMLLEAMGIRIKLVSCGKENIKITTAEDLDYAEFLLEKRKRNA